MNNIKISDRELQCLKVLGENQEDYYDEEYGWMRYKYIMAETKLNLGQVRRSIRSLLRKGLAEYSTLFDDDGMLNGSGHHISKDGWNYLYKN